MSVCVCSIDAAMLSPDLSSISPDFKQAATSSRRRRETGRKYEEVKINAEEREGLPNEQREEGMWAERGADGKDRTGENEAKMRRSRIKERPR